MKSFKLTLMCAAVSLACSQSGICAFLVGSVDPGSPASTSAEKSYVETLLGLGANAVYNNDGKTYRTFGYDAPVVSITEVTKFDPPKPLTITGYQFVLGKFGNTSWLWELTFGEEFVIPKSYGDKFDKGGGLSHYTVFNGSSTPPNKVPDSGTSIALLGLSLIGFGGLRKFFGKA